MPRVNFKKISLDENIELIKYFYFLDDGDDSLDIYKSICECFPKIGLIDDNLSAEEKTKLITDIVKEKYISSENKIDSDVDRYNEIWNKYNDDYVNALSEYLGVSWPDIDVFDAKVGVLPLAPRDIDEFSFCLNVGIPSNFVIDITAHELCHFLWFVKWKELFPGCDSESFNSPNLPWKYSEMVIDPILNSKMIKDILGVDIFAYESFYEIKDGNSLLMDNLRNIYASDELIDEKIKLGYDYVDRALKKNKIKKGL